MPRADETRASHTRLTKQGLTSHLHYLKKVPAPALPLHRFETLGMSLGLSQLPFSQLLNEDNHPPPTGLLGRLNEENAFGIRWVIKW